MKYLKTVLLSIALSVMLYLLVNRVDALLFQSKLYNSIVFKSDCNFIIPPKYRLVYSESTKRYAIQDLEFTDYYLYTYDGDIKGMFSSIAKCSTFKDSCLAKGYLKAKLEMDYERDSPKTDLKPIK